MNSKSKKILSLSLAAVLTVACVTFARPLPQASAATTPSVVLDGKLLTFDVPPQIINDRTMLPFRGIAEAMGARVDWDPDSQKVSMYLGSSYVFLTVGNPDMTYGSFTYDSYGAEAPDTAYTYVMDSPPVIVGGRTLVPARAVSEGLGAEVGWDAATSTVTITSPPEPAETPAPTPTPTPTPTATPTPTQTPSPSPAGPYGATDNFETITPAAAQKMYDDGTPFLLFYYSSADAGSLSAFNMVMGSAADCGFKVFGLDAGDPAWNSGDISFLWSYAAKSDKVTPTLVCVIAKNVVNAVNFPTSEADVDYNMDEFFRLVQVSPSIVGPPSWAWKEVGFVEANLLQNSGENFVLVVYDSKDSGAADMVKSIKTSALRSVVASGRTVMVIKVYALDIAGYENVNWWGAQMVADKGGAMEYPAVFYVQSDQNLGILQARYEIRPQAINFNYFLW
ncbi:MAG: copper amine oxidase N-terminal domain-containing protein [Defluviitaleaceae bacterium]|nr:copper amine oxidase N-terminal domain-containing protein [Defluviitaleaceae bacterium]